MTIEKHNRQFASNAELRRFEAFRVCSKCGIVFKRGESIVWNKENEGKPQHAIACPINKSE